MTAKKKLIRNTIISITAIVLLLVCYFCVINWDTEEKTSDVKTQITFVVSEKIKEVDSIHIKNSDSEYEIVLNVDSQGELSCDIPVLNGRRADSEQIKTAALSLLKLTATDVLTQNGQNLKDFGLEGDGSGCYVVKKKNGDNLTVMLGNKTPDGRGVYCTVLGKSEIYVINSYDATAVFAEPDDYCDTSILKISNALDIEKLVIVKNNEKVMQIEASPASADKSENVMGGIWRLTYPWYEDVDTEKFMPILNNIITIKATGFGVETAEPDWKYEVNLLAKGMEYNLRIGKESSDGTIYLSDGNSLFIVDKSVWDLMESVNPDSYLLKFVNLVYMDDVNGISINYGDKEYRMEPGENGKAYIFCGAEISEQDFKKLYQTIVGTIYTEHTTITSDGKVYMKISYDYKDGKRETVEYYKYNERNFIAVRPDKTKVIVLQSELKKIIDLINGF